MPYQIDSPLPFPGPVIPDASSTRSGLMSAAQAAKLAGLTPGGGGGNAILWDPLGGGDAATWAEVMAFVNAVDPPVTIYVEGATGVIPAGTYEMKNAILSGRGTDTGGSAATCADGAVLRNVGSIQYDFTLRSVSSSPCLDFDYTLGKPRSLIVQLGAGLETQGTSQMIEVPTMNFFILILINGSLLLTSTPGVGTVLLDPGSALLLVLELFPPDAISDFVQGDATTVLGYIHFGTPGPYPTPTGFFGTVLNLPVTVAGGSGPTAQRPILSLLPIPLGCMYFDTGIAPPRPIWWDGVGWVDATGAPA